MTVFLSTFPRRERHYITSSIVYNFFYFYPRSHVGNDRGAFSEYGQDYGISIHVPT